MLFIQYLASVFSFVLLIHRGVGKSSKQICRDSLLKLFSYVLRDQVKIDGYAPLLYYFILDDNLIEIINELPDPPSKRSRGQIAAHKEQMSQAVILNNFQIGTRGNDALSVKFFVHDSKRRSGTAEIVCRKDACEDVVKKFEENVSANRVSCLEQVKDKFHSMQINQGRNGVTVNLYEWSFDLFNSAEILFAMVRSEEGVIDDRPWRVTEALLDGTSLILKDKDGKVVAQRTPKGFGYDEVDVDYIGAAIKFKNAIYKTKV